MKDSKGVELKDVAEMDDEWIRQNRIMIMRLAATARFSKIALVLVCAIVIIAFGFILVQNNSFATALRRAGVSADLRHMVVLDSSMRHNPARPHNMRELHNISQIVIFARTIEGEGVFVRLHPNNWGFWQVYDISPERISWYDYYEPTDFGWSGAKHRNISIHTDYMHPALGMYNLVKMYNFGDEMILVLRRLAE